MLTPSSLPFQSIGKSLRFGTMLRAFSLISPGSAIGVTIGSGWYSTSTSAGILFIPARWVAAIVGVAVYYISQRWGRSTVKDLTLLAIAGLISGTVTALKILIIAKSFGDVFQDPAQIAALWKIGVTMAMTMAGYPFVLAFEAVRGSGKNG